VKILFVEDNRDLATNLFDYFESRGHVIDLAYDGITGFKMAATNNYDAVVLDWMLPELDGVTICKKLRKEGNDTPILMLTARDSVADKITGLASGANDYMIKPFSMRNVESRLLMLAHHK
jgi:DNA-binding response OmpR family regulator